MENAQKPGVSDSEILEEMADIDLDAELQSFDSSAVQPEPTPEPAVADEASASATPAGNENIDDANSNTVIEELRREIETLKAQVEDRSTQYMRIAADFDNFRRRTQKEKEEMEQQIKCSTISELLPVVDNFERARSQLKPQTDQEMNIHKSYQGVYKLLVDCLKRVGVSPMRSEGKEFDPSLHEAVMREPTDQHPEDTVIEELVRGYMLGERVLRHAMVKVAVAPEPMVPSEENGQEQASD